MKKLIIVAITLLALNSCENPPDYIRTEDLVLKPKSSLGKFPYENIDELRVVVIDSCEYIVCNAIGFKDPTMTHKGNCSNKIHIYNENRK